MDNRKNIKRALSGVLIGGLLFTGGIAFAADAKNDSNSSAQKPFMGPGQLWGGKGQGMRHNASGRAKFSAEMVTKLVADGVITQEKADEIKAYIEKRIFEKRAKAKKTNLFDELVSSKILTQVQADSIKAKLHEIRQNEHQQQLSAGLKTLVESGTISQEQSVKILKRLADVHKARATVMEQTKDMTREERRAYLQENNEIRQKPIAQLVDEGIITQEQANAVRKVIFPGKGFRGGQKRPL